LKNSLVEIYNSFAETYDENRGLFDMTEVFQSFYSQLDTEKGNLLDLGCGAGESFTKFFTDLGWNATGVDFSQKMLEMAKKYIPGMEAICADMREVEFSENHFDAITSIYSLFHVPSVDHEGIFRNWYRWLKPDGKALFTYATKEYTGLEEFDGYKEFLEEKLFYSHITPIKLYTNLEKVGFEILATDYRTIGDEIFLWITINKPSNIK